MENPPTSIALRLAEPTDRSQTTSKEVVPSTVLSTRRTILGLDTEPSRLSIFALLPTDSKTERGGNCTVNKFSFGERLAKVKSALMFANLPSTRTTLFTVASASFRTGTLLDNGSSNCKRVGPTAPRISTTLPTVSL